jgi:hypothetical protein
MIKHAISLSSTLALLMLAAAGRRVGTGRTAVPVHAEPAGVLV